MGEPAQPVQLRALGIGEIFDRAITLLVRNWAPFCVVAAVGVLPSQGLELLGVTRGSTLLAGMGVLLGPFLSTIETLAIAKLVGQLYTGESIRCGSALLLGLQRLPRAIGAGFLIGLMVAGGFLVFALIGAILATLHLAGVTIVIEVILFLVALPPVILASQYVLAAMAIDDYGAVASIGKAFELFHQAEARKTFLFALSFALVSVAGPIAIQLVLQFGMAWGIILPLAYLAAAALTFVSSAIAAALIAVFYFDVRIRREGYDLQVALDALENPA